jgi:cytochrome c peroxidase
MTAGHRARASIHAVLAALLGVAPVVAGEGSHALLGLPTIKVPAENPITPAKIALGKKLFMDRRLSPNNTLSCAMCHVPEQGFTQQELATSVGFEGKSLRRNAPTLLNVTLHENFQRDGAKASLEAQVWGPLLAHNEMANGTVEAVVERLKKLPDYRGLFEAAFVGQGPNQESVGQALASYERTLLSANSRFDRWYFGHDAQALSGEEQAGFELFKRANCAACHLLNDEAAPFTDNRFHDTGVSAAKRQHATIPISVQLAPGVSININVKDLANVSEPDQADSGRFEVTQNAADQNAFKTPTLRNIALTPPYMHDGSIATLSEVIDLYALRAACAPGPSLTLSANERVQLLAFLRSLTGSNVVELAADARAAFVNY